MHGISFSWEFRGRISAKFLSGGEIFFLDQILKRIAFLFGSFITFEPINANEIIPEYQGEIYICKILRYVT